jgi:hypothetical protein
VTASRRWSPVCPRASRRGPCGATPTGGPTAKRGPKELRAGFASPTLCRRSFWASEPALSLAPLTDNLSVLFQRHLGWQKKVTIHTLRFRRFATAAVLSHPRGKTTIKRAARSREPGRWSRLWGKILSPWPNCNAVENRPVFAP